LEGLYAPPAKLILGKIVNAKGVFWAIPSSFAVMRLMPWHDLVVHALCDQSRGKDREVTHELAGIQRRSFALQDQGKLPGASE
jgi:hypothetical protein